MSDEYEKTVLQWGFLYLGGPFECPYLTSLLSTMTHNSQREEVVGGPWLPFVSRHARSTR